MRKYLKYILLAIVIVIIFIAIIIIRKNNKEALPSEELLGINYGIDGNRAELNYETKNPVAALYVEGYGSIVVELYPDIAPNTVNNFVQLIKDGYYDNNTIHRVQKDFVLQGGDPTGTGVNNPGFTIKGEFSANGYTENDLSHTKGVISMARSGYSMDSASTQFFIMLGDNTSLDGNYAAFGKVIDGYELLDKINEEAKPKTNSSMGELIKPIKLKKVLIDQNGKHYGEPERITQKN